MSFLDRLAAGLAGGAAAALVMAEMQWTSMWGNWQPTHLSSIALGILSIAASQISASAKSGPAKGRSGSAA